MLSGLHAQSNANLASSYVSSASLAQWLERSAVNRKVAGSIPAGGGFFRNAECLNQFNLISVRHFTDVYLLRWSSGYDARLTRERSPVQSRDEVLFASKRIHSLDVVVCLRAID